MKMHISFLLSIAIAAQTVGIEPNSDLLAHYKFDGDGIDDCRTSSPFELNKTAFVENTLYLNGKYEHGSGNGYRAIAPISGLTYEAFTISLEFNPVFVGTREGFLARLSGNTMRTNNIITGGTSYRWFSLRRAKNNNLEITLNNQDNSFSFKNAPIRENTWNHVVCSVDIEKGVIKTYFNGVMLEDITLQSDFSLEVEPSDKDEELTFTNYSNGNAYFGYADNLRIWNRGLNKDEIQGVDFVHPLGQVKKINWGKWGSAILILLIVFLGLYYRIRKRSPRRTS